VEVGSPGPGIICLLENQIKYSSPFRQKNSHPARVMEKNVLWMVSSFTPVAAIRLFTWCDLPGFLWEAGFSGG